ATPGLPAEPGPAITSPTAEQLDRLITAAASIKPGLVENADTLARRADSTCLDLREGADPAAVVSDVQRRFSGGGADGLTEDEAARLAEAIRSTVCP
ncbi:DUF732 domain-containing protein, partial [Kineococcus indalonis]|uniref:DUF732 domain-containing protein n=1 Tax=Kineococcus indalonis TaxID=2696566 RepID=UPI001412B9B0